MRTLSKQEVTLALQYAQRIPENQGSSILDKFQNEQPVLYQAVLGELLDVIARENTDMAYLFLDLCFDVICVYRQAYGEPPANVIDLDWLDKKAVLLNSELKSLTQTSTTSEEVQTELLNALELCAETYAAIKPERKNALHLIGTLLLVVVRLFDALYNEAESKTESGYETLGI